MWALRWKFIKCRTTDGNGLADESLVRWQPSRGVEAVERSKVVTAFAQYGVAAGVRLGALDDPAHDERWDIPVKIGAATVRPPITC
jgi:hypothetical protein